VPRATDLRPQRRGLELAARLDVVVFDKTGTLTEGRPRVTDLVNLSSWTDTFLLERALAVESGSEHFLGRAIAAEAREQVCTGLRPMSSRARPGRGVQARVGAQRVLLGNRDYLEEHGVGTDRLEGRAEQLAAQGKTPVLMALDGTAVALFGVADRPRPAPVRLWRACTNSGSAPCW